MLWQGHSYVVAGSFVQVPEQDANAEKGTKMTEEVSNFIFKYL